MPNTEKLTHADLVKMLHYEADKGVFYWRIKRGKMLPGDVAGKNVRGKYIQIGINRTNHYAHRLAWFYTHGRHPNGPIDHINGDKSDNRLANLRVVSCSENQQNRQLKAQRNSRCGLIGVQWHGPTKRWRAMIRVNNERISLGYFSTPEEAHQRYLEAKLKHHTY